MGEREEWPYVVIERHESGVGPFLWGALVGAAVALLLAPRTGADTQAEIRERARRLRDEATGRYTGARDSVVGALERTRTTLQDQVGSVREAVEERAAQARHAVETGRRAARDARTELEERLSRAKHAATGGDGATGGDPMPSLPGDDVVITEVGGEDPVQRPLLD